MARNHPSGWHANHGSSENTGFCDLKATLLLSIWILDEKTACHYNLSCNKKTNSSGPRGSHSGGTSFQEKAGRLTWCSVWSLPPSLQQGTRQAASLWCPVLFSHIVSKRHHLFLGFTASSCSLKALAHLCHLPPPQTCSSVRLEILS